ncbi:MAG: hypothetical protein FVQ85_01000 [Planctomycetes bacterium]|nr:hypothetical protein [Planctomycetota bacterium]
MSLLKVFLTFLKILLLLFLALMMKFQIPELRYDLGTKEMVHIQSPADLSTERFQQSTFVSIRGKADFTKAATFVKYGVPYTYFLLDEHGSKLVVRSPEALSEKWAEIDSHIGRLRPFHRMPFSRSVRAGFLKLFDVGIPEDAFFLARDDVPRPSGWSIGGVAFAGILWCVLVYLFFIHSRFFRPLGRKGHEPAVQVDV